MEKLNSTKTIAQLEQSAKQNLTPSKIGEKTWMTKLDESEIKDIETVELVLESQKIADISDKELAIALKPVFVMVGLRQHHLPANQEITMLLSFIRRTYGKKTIKELVLAFDLAIQGRLNVDDVKVYDQFSCEYVARIMNGYREWLSMVSRLKQSVQQPKMIEGQKELSEADWILWLNDMRSYDINLIPVTAYDFLIRTERVVMSPKIVLESNFRATKKYLSSLDPVSKEASALRKMMENGEITGKDLIAKIELLAQKIIVKNYLKANPELNISTKKVKK